MKETIRVENLLKHYKDKIILNNINLKITEGKLFTILGTEGSGKTTLLKILAGIEKQDGGLLWVGDKNIIKKKTYERNIGIVFEDYGLFPEFTVEQNLLYALKAKKMSEQDKKAKVESAIQLMQLQEIKDKFVGEMSNDQQFLVALARASIYEPSMVLLDDPFKHFGGTVREHLIEQLRRIQRETKITMIHVTSNKNIALALSDEIAILYKGKIEQVGTVKVLMYHPETLHVAEVIGKCNLLVGHVVKKEIMGENCRLTIKSRCQTNFEVIIPLSRKRVLADSIMLAVQPEQLFVITEPMEGVNKIVAKIVEVSNLNRIISIKLVTSMGKEILLKITEEEGAKLSLVGEVTLGFRPEDAWVIYEKEVGKLFV